jgi:TRAP-type C4-dicarboxylate transport system permease large subunit
VSIVAFTILGSVLEGIPAIVLFGPLLFPIARAVGRPRGALCDDRHPRHGHRTVRSAVRSRLLCGLRHWARRSRRGIKPIWGYLLALLVGLIIVAIFPWISIGFL